MTDTETTEVEHAIANVVQNIDGVSDRVIDGLDDKFGTASRISEANPSELQEVEGIGPVLGRKIARRTSSAKKNPEIHVEGDLYSQQLRGGLR